MSNATVCENSSINFYINEISIYYKDYNDTNNCDDIDNFSIENHDEECESVVSNVRECN